MTIETHTGRERDAQIHTYIQFQSVKSYFVYVCACAEKLATVLPCSQRKCVTFLLWKIKIFHSKLISVCFCLLTIDFSASAEG